MSAKSHQLQWRNREGEMEWKFHSRVVPDEATAQIIAYHSRPIRSFDYRLIANDSKDALAPVAETVYAGRMETLPPPFPGGRSAA